MLPFQLDKNTPTLALRDYGISCPMIGTVNESFNVEHIYLSKEAKASASAKAEATI